MTRNKKPSKIIYVWSSKEDERQAIALVNGVENNHKKNILALKRKLEKYFEKDGMFMLMMLPIADWEKIWDDFMKEKE